MPHRGRVAWPCQIMSDRSELCYGSEMSGESELEMVRRHVAEGQRHVRSQHEIVVHLREMGAPTEIAEQLERQFEELLEMHRQHLSRLDEALAR